MPRNKLPMPPQDRVRSDDVGNLFKRLSPKELTLDTQLTPLVVVEQDSFFPWFLPEHSVLCQKVVDRILLATIDPAGEDQKEQLPGLQACLHIFLRIRGENPQHRASMTACQAAHPSNRAAVANNSHRNGLWLGRLFLPYGYGNARSLALVEFGCPEQPHSILCATQSFYYDCIVAQDIL